MPIDVSLELAPADESAPQARLLLEACNLAMHPAQCVVGRDAGAMVEGTAIAILRWSQNHTDARIEVGLRIDGTAAWRKRDVFFSPADPEEERWRTVGYAVATLVGEAVAGKPSEPSTNANPTSIVSQTSNPGGRNLGEGKGVGKGVHFWLDAQFALETGIPGSEPSLGAEIRLSSLVFCSRCLVSGALLGTFEQWALASVSVLQATAALGGGFVILHVPRLDVAVRAEALLRFIDATGIDPATGNAGSGRRWGVGFTERVDAAWMWSTRIGFVAGVGFSEMTAATELTGHGHALIYLPAVHLDSVAGLRLAFP